MSACNGSPIHPDGCPTTSQSYGYCWCDCHGQCDECDNCGDEFDLDDLDDSGLCPGCVSMPLADAA